MKWVKRIIIGFLALVLLLVCGVVYLFLNPQIVLTPHNIEWARKKWLNSDSLNVDWSDLTISHHRLAWNKRKLIVSANDICLSVKPQIQQLCFKTFHIETIVGLDHFTPTLYKIGPVSATEGTADIAFTQDASKNTSSASMKSIPFFHPRLPWYLAKTEFDAIKIDIAHMDVREDGDLHVSGKVAIEVQATSDGRLSDVHLLSSGEETKQHAPFHLNLRANSVTGYVESDAHITASGNASSNEWGHSEFKSEAFMNPQDILKGSLSLSWKKKDVTLFNTATFALSPETINVTMAGTLQKNIYTITSAKWENCAITLKNQKESLALKCDVSVPAKDVSLPQALGPYYIKAEPQNAKLKDRITAHIQIDGHVPFLEYREDPWNLNSTFSVDTIEDSLVKLNVKGNAKYVGLPEKGFKMSDLSGNIQADVLVASFQKIVNMLENSPYAIPAPLYVLDGPMNLHLKGELSEKGMRGIFPMTFDIDLASQEQVLKVSAKGETQLRLQNQSLKAMTLDYDIAVHDIKLRLPDIEVGAPPKLNRDDRFVTNEHATQSKSDDLDIRYHFRIRTDRSQSILLLSNLVEHPVPVTLDIVAESHQPLEGKVSLGKATVELFRRKATIKSMDLALDSPFGASTISGDINIRQLEYLVIIKIRGTVERPNVLFESSPPLSQEEIISVLLYSEPLTTLDTGQVDSVGQLSSAISNRALAIFSLYYLSATPIQRINYDPTTKTVSARVRLGDKTSLILGGGETQREIGIRRRIGGGFFIKTGVEKDATTGDTQGTGYLEWYKRF